MYETITYRVENGIAWLTLNRPDKLNAFTSQMNSEIKKAIKASAGSDDVRAIIITGEGRAFCSGQDLSEVDESKHLGQVLREDYGPMMQQIAGCEKPIIAAVNGVAAGAGFSLALACDFRLVSENASFINAFVNIGLIPDSGNLYYLTRIVGHAKALELSLLGEKVSASEAKSIGLATKVIGVGEWNEQLKAFAGNIAAKPTKAIGLIKRYLEATYHLTLDEYLTEEAEGQRIAGLTQDFAEGVAAFTEKRKAQFIGK
ncbi:2-(1,2-epoxy-1,2-dihydrophenyl)acetyl-CoA isomerase [Peribacillus muralis]|uniref:2-(1,2-epoxy-1,2-dihydrophenyl)acetyl-CoA isomerase n=1 Tax=Peribacillus muralis TaxID=264697 RepID=A0A1B3XKH6_9BACI|nr:enoyl-CoA hydratase-related protein [Peribacillus muralis]AOH53723.1 2-(1,2-epoxy-1,2-dihydrophenyl)acetyl-CoA isomerase [Peribacillus muralis]